MAKNGKGRLGIEKMVGNGEGRLGIQISGNEEGGIGNGEGEIGNREGS